MPFDKPHVSEIETKDLRLLHNKLEEAKAALERKGGSIQNPITKEHLEEASDQMRKILKLDQPRYEAVD